MTSLIGAARVAHLAFDRMGVDRSTMQWIDEHRTWTVNGIARAITFVGTSRFVFAAVAVVGLVYVWRARQWRLAVACGVAWVMAQVVTGAAKSVIDRPRPPHHLALLTTTGSAMPSTAAALTSAVAVAFFLTCRWPSPRVRRLGAWALALVVAVFGACVVYIGVHWPSDVLVGWLVGVAVGAGSATAARRLPTRSSVSGRRARRAASP